MAGQGGSGGTACRGARLWRSRRRLLARGVRGHDSGSSARPQARSSHRRQRPPWPRREGERAEERDEERRKKEMTCGACVSVTEEMKYTSSYMPAAGPYVFSGIFVGNEEF